MESILTPDKRMDLAGQCVKCGLCLPHCPTYAIAQAEAESPRGRIQLMASMAQSPALYGRDSLQALDNCLGCRRCESACPALVPYDALLVSTRATHAPALSWRAKAALWLMAHKRWLNRLLGVYRFSFHLLPRGLKILPTPENCAAKPRLPASAAAGRSAVFSGCLADTYEAGARLALIKLLGALGEAADIPDDQVCCGQAALHAGDHGTAERLGVRNRRAFAGYDRLLVLASGCFSAVKPSAGIPAIDAMDFLQARQDSLRFRSAQGAHIALHTPCSASFQGQHAALGLLQCIPDLQISLIADQGCCGAAGLHQLTQADRASALAAPVIAAVHASGASLLLSQNIGCRLHLAKEAGVPVLHPIEFMAQFLHDIATPIDAH
jgi:glycolate oxidase iron-sulfur subunit